jgi:hypothetical protein
VKLDGGGEALVRRRGEALVARGQKNVRSDEGQSLLSGPTVLGRFSVSSGAKDGESSKTTRHMNEILLFFFPDLKATNILDGTDYFRTHTCVQLVQHLSHA